MQRFAYWLFPLIAGAVALFIVVFMIQINPSAPTWAPEGENEDNASLEPLPKEEASWLARFSLGEEKGYLYPINDVSLILDMPDSAPAASRYRLSVPLKSSYELFCLKQELKNSGLPYFFQKEGKTMTLLVESDDQNRLATLVTKLKTYQISATLSPYTEE